MASLTSLRSEGAVRPPSACPYVPESSDWNSEELVREPGLEPGTYGLENRCSIQLSYSRITIYSASQNAFTEEDEQGNSGILT